jgi:hypothetical protein
MHDPKVPPKTEVASEDAWEEEVLSQALGDALKPDGDIEFDKVRATGLTMTLDELHPEGDEDDKA